MTRVFLAAGVAALAIAAPASAGPHGGGGQHASAPHNKNGGGGQRHNGGGSAAPQRHAQQKSAPRVQHAPRVQAQHAQAHQQRAGRAQTRMAARQQTQQKRGHAQQRAAARQQTHAKQAQAQTRQNRQQLRANRAQHAQNVRANRVQHAQNGHPNRNQQAQNRSFQRPQGQFQRQQMQANRKMARQDMRLNRQQAIQHNLANRQQLKAIRQMAVPHRVAALRNMGDARFAAVPLIGERRFLAPAAARALVGVPLATAAGLATFNPLPRSFTYLYPSTPNYYYQYGDGYVYQIDRGSNLIGALFPLLGGGYLPGSYLPAAYMSSYVPSYYGMNSFYPASYGYGGLCNRYSYGVVYQVDCVTGMVENVIPMYAGGYGVGQLLPASYSYYNVPYQYRDMYYDTPDYGYWYAPGAIYQYDRGSSLITSVAALMSPGFTIGQALPAGYGMYNVPMSYRATYYDTRASWYRYNNGYIYQVDPSTMLVTAIVASLLT